MRKVICALVVAVLLVGCDKSKRKIDASGSDVGVKIVRFDVDFWNMDRGNIQQSLERLYAQYPLLLPLYTEQSLGIGEWNDAEAVAILEQDFFPNEVIQQLYADCMKTFAKVDRYEEQLTKAFRRANVCFPQKHVPQICFHVCAGARTDVIFYKDSLLSIAIDNYLGADYPLYQEATYAYLRYSMRPEMLVPDILTAWTARNFPFTTQGGRLLDEMLYRGKVMYLLSVLLPEVDEALLMGYTPEQWKWCEEQEHSMWMSLVESKHLFSTQGLLISKYLHDAPFTSYFSNESPGRCGVFLGWRIVKSYMEHHPEVSFEALMSNQQYEQILQQSQYNP